MKTYPKYSSKSVHAIATLKRHRNEIDIYVEDTKHWRTTQEIIIKHIPEDVKISEVYPLGGRDAVINAAAISPKHKDRVELYIIDPDIDIISKQRVHSSRYLVALTRYCAENYIFEFDSVKNAVTQDAPHLTDREIADELKFDELIDMINKFDRLYKIYACAKRLGVKEKLTDYNIYRLCDRKNGFIVPSSKKIARRCRHVLRLLRENFNHNDIRDSWNFIEWRANSIGKPIYYISGKYIHLPIFHEYAKNVFQTRSSRDNFSTRVALGSPVSHCPKLVSRLKKAMAAYTS